MSGLDLSGHDPVPFSLKKKKKKDDGRFVAPLEDTKRERKREREGKEIKKIKK